MKCFGECVLNIGFIKLVVQRSNKNKAITLQSGH